MESGFTPLDILVLVVGIGFFFVVRHHISRGLKKLLKWSLILILLVTVYGLASTVSRISLEKAQDQSLAFFQEFMDQGSQAWLKKNGGSK